MLGKACPYFILYLELQVYPVILFPKFSRDIATLLIEHESVGVGYHDSSGTDMKELVTKMPGIYIVFFGTYACYMYITISKKERKGYSTCAQPEISWKLFGNADSVQKNLGYNMHNLAVYKSCTPYICCVSSLICL